MTNTERRERNARVGALLCKLGFHAWESSVFAYAATCERCFKLRPGDNKHFHH